MADAIVRLRVESSEYDQKLSRATQQLQHMEKEVRRTGATFAYADKEELAFIQSLGSMETKATSARQKLREYSEAITSMTATYRNLTQEEKSSPFGQAIAASIDKLKAKAAELQDIMSDTQREIQNLASDTSFTDGIGLMTRTVGSCAAAITAWTGDSKEMEAVIKDLAKIGTTVAAVDSLTKAFQKQNLVLLKNPYVAAAAAVVALGVAIGKLIQKSQELDSVQKTLNEVQAKGRDNAAKEMAQIDTLNSILHDNTRSLEDRKAALSEIQALVPNYHGALTEEGNLINDNTGAIDDYIDSLQRAATAQAAFDKMVELQKKKMQQQVELQEKQKNLQVAQARNERAQGEVVYAGSEMTQVYTQMDTSSAERAVQQAEADIRATNAEIDALRNLVKATDVSNGTTTATTTTSKGGKMKVEVEPVLPEGSAAALKKQISELQDAWNKASTQDERNSIKGQIDAASEALKAMTPQIEPVDAAIKDAAAMWTEHSEKIADVKARLEEFKAMVTDTSLTDAQRDWAQGMADAYQEQLDKMTGATEEAANNMSESLDKIPTKFELMQESLDKMSTGIGAISTIGNAFNDLKGIGEDLASAFSGEMDAWDSLMTVFNSGISIMQTVIGVMEAINTLQELSSTLSKKKVADQAAETTAVVTGKGTEAAANLQEAGTSMTAAGANAAESSSAAGKAVAGIPIVGPILAVAAIAAVLAATFAAMSKAKSAGKFAQGGIIPGNSFSGDNQIASVNAGELILSRSQQATIAGQLQGAAQQTIMVEGRISGKDILLSANNTNRAAGGSRGYYTKVK